MNKSLFYVELSVYPLAILLSSPLSTGEWTPISYRRLDCLNLNPFASHRDLFCFLSECWVLCRVPQGLILYMRHNLSCFHLRVLPHGCRLFSFRWKLISSLFFLGKVKERRGENEIPFTSLIWLRDFWIKWFIIFYLWIISNRFSNFPQLFVTNLGISFTFLLSFPEINIMEPFFYQNLFPIHSCLKK